MVYKGLIGQGLSEVCKALWPLCSGNMSHVRFNITLMFNNVCLTMHFHCFIYTLCNLLLL